MRQRKQVSAGNLALPDDLRERFLANHFCATR